MDHLTVFQLNQRDAFCLSLKNTLVTELRVKSSPVMMTAFSIIICNENNNVYHKKEKKEFIPKPRLHLKNLLCLWGIKGVLYHGE